MLIIKPKIFSQIDSFETLAQLLVPCFLLAIDSVPIILKLDISLSRDNNRNCTKQAGYFASYKEKQLWRNGVQAKETHLFQFA